MSEDIRDIRLQKLARMRELGHDPFSVEEFKRTASAKELLEWFDDLTAPRGDEDDESTDGPPTISFAGRVISYRDMGKAGFAHLSDGDGKIQIYCRKDELGEVGWELYQLLDIGDHVGVEGFMFLTKTGEKSIHVKRLVPLSKSLQTLPIGKEKDGQQWYGLEDVEQRYRHRHLDLITNPEARKALIDRAKIVSAVRRYFDGAGYLEVETPLLQVVAGGAAARPFTTHYNAYDMEVKLRISLELYLKRLICGDIPAVYEIGRVFRNEGVSNRHNPEFTLLEFYEAYTNLEGMMRRVEDMFAFVAREVLGATAFLMNGPALTPYFNLLREMTGGRFRDTFRVGNFMVCRVDRKSRSFRTLLNGLLETEPTLKHPNVAGQVWVSGPVIAQRVLDLMFLTVRSTCQIENGFDVELLKKGTYVVFPIPFTNEIQSEGLLFVDFAKPWRRVDLLSEICAQSGLERDDLADLDRAKAAIRAKGIVDKAHQLGGHIDLNKEDNLGGLIEKLLEVFVEPTLQEPTFVVGYPIETSPLAKKDPNNPRMTRRFEGYILGREICNAFSEINDPIDQKERFEQQATEIAKGDDEAHPYDEEFLYALEGGMPPTGGCGIGMERLAMVLTGSDHIREIMFFPMMKPRD
jgi:lysyl-tRNA synthetase class II